MNHTIISGAAWKACAVELKATLDAFYNRKD